MEALASSERATIVLDEPRAWRDKDPLATAELANFEATLDEVLLLWANAFAADSRRASATRDIVCRALKWTDGVVDCGLADDGLVVLADGVGDNDECVWPRVKWRLVPMEPVVCS